jgi:hypothetical protein
MTDQADGASRRQPVRSKSVTHVPGTACHLCDRYAPWLNAAGKRNRTSDLLITKVKKRTEVQKSLRCVCASAIDRTADRTGAVWAQLDRPSFPFASTRSWYARQVE